MRVARRSLLGNYDAGKLPLIRSLRDVMALLPLYDMDNLDTLRQLIYALGHANMKYLNAAQPAPPVQEDLARAMVLRGIFSAGASALVARGLLDEKRLSEVKGGPGYQNAVTDMGFYAELYRGNLDVFLAHTGVQLSEIR